MLRMFCSSRQPVWLEVFRHRTCEGKAADISITQEQTHCEEVLRTEFTTARGIALAYIFFVNESRETRVRSPQGLSFDPLHHTGL